MYDGVVKQIRTSLSPNQYSSKEAYGNFVIIKSVVDGKTVSLQYAHLNSVNAMIMNVDNINKPVKVGDLIGYSGKTGNAAYVPVPHLHLRAFGKTDSEKLDPADYLKTKFDRRLSPIPCN